MEYLIQIAVKISMYTFILTSLFGAGLGLTVKEIIEPLKKLKIAVFALISNFILIPAAAYALSIIFKADQSLQIGLIIIACCGGAPFLPRLITIAKGSMAYTIGLMVMLMVVTVGFVPLVLPLLIPGVEINPLDIAKPLIILMLIPLACGLIVKAWKPSFAALIKPIMEKSSSISMIVWALFALIIDYKLIISAYGTGVYNLALLFTLCALFIGYFMGGPSKPEKRVMMLGSGARNIAAALIIAVSNFSEPRVVTVVLISSLVQAIILFLSAFMIGRLQKN